MLIHSKLFNQIFSYLCQQFHIKTKSNTFKICLLWLLSNNGAQWGETSQISDNPQICPF